MMNLYLDEKEKGIYNMVDSNSRYFLFQRDHLG